MWFTIVFWKVDGQNSMWQVWNKSWHYCFSFDQNLVFCVSQHHMFCYFPLFYDYDFYDFYFICRFLNSSISNWSTESQHQNQIKIQKASDHGDNSETSYTLVRCEIQSHTKLELWYGMVKCFITQFTRGNGAHAILGFVRHCPTLSDIVRHCPT